MDQKLASFEDITYVNSQSNAILKIFKKWNLQKNTYLFRMLPDNHISKNLSINTTARISLICLGLFHLE